MGRSKKKKKVKCGDIDNKLKIKLAKILIGVNDVEKLDSYNRFCGINNFEKVSIGDILLNVKINGDTIFPSRDMEIVLVKGCESEAIFGRIYFVTRKDGEPALPYGGLSRYYLNKLDLSERMYKIGSLN